jgi:uncharacterized membrane protein (UPF0127 family)
MADNVSLIAQDFSRVEKRAAFPQVPPPMKLFTVLTAGLLAVLPGCKEDKQPSVPPQTNAAVRQDAPYLPYAQPRLQTIKLYVGAEELMTECALKPVEIYTGMMWRTNMAENEAMIFAFPTGEQRSFYMRNTLVPLSAAYIDPEGVIQEIHDLHPRDETGVDSQSSNIQYVLEVKQGWFTRHNISTGSVIRTQYGALKQTFRFQR